MLPYSSFRAAAAGRGVDVLMVEHRGVGLSRQDADGVDLPPEALTVSQVVDDLAAVLDDCGVDQAVVYGWSYGTYLAQRLGVRHPERIAGMVLGSVVLSAQDDQVVREFLRDLYWHGRSSQTARAAELMRRAVAAGVVPVETTGAVAQIVHEFAGPAALERLLRLRLDGRGRWIWNRVARLGADEITPAGRCSWSPTSSAGSRTASSATHPSRTVCRST
ncbi:alpha/beta hydrolase [Blastococcus montanus]|uniref:alpha/beta fold hydrolase n=1 Tax=Blastococcus montanus TaxID=3144973 RepID=UPI00320B6179